MNEAPYFAPYPRARSPVYSRWWLSGAALLSVLIVGGKLFLADLYEPRVMIVGMVGVLLLWLLVFLLRVLYVHFNQHFAHTYTVTARQIQRAWWTHHRQTAALVEAVLVGPVCSSVEDRQKLFTADHQPPEPVQTTKGEVSRVWQVMDEDTAGRERELAALLAIQWRRQHEAPITLHPLRCYWQGTASAWAAFVEQMASSCPQVKLPEHPEPWQGLASLDVIIDQLQGAAANARILCAGCASLPPQANSHLPAGEAAVLWLLGTQGGVRFCRGEWFAAESEDLATVAERVLQQSELDKPAPACVSFSQPEITELSALNWNIRPFVQDANFGALGSLETMVVQTLAAAYAQVHGVPCAWLGNDPHHTLTLGVVKPDDSRT
jgi:hypothetical protein